MTRRGTHGPRRPRRARVAAAGLLGIGVAVALAASGCGGGGGEAGAADAGAAPGDPAFTSTECGTYSGTGCAPQDRRVDLVKPTFSNPTTITNPLFPISDLASAVLLGSEDGTPFRSETTLLPGTRTVSWDGRQIPTLASQYTAYLDGRIAEVTLDRYAQPTTARSGTSARTSWTTTTATWRPPRAPGWPARRARRR